MGLFDLFRLKYRNNSEGSQCVNIKPLVNRCLKLEKEGEINELQNCLYELYSKFNKCGGGSLILQYEEKDNLALCFAFMLQYDWMHDSDIREVFAENGFYCIIDYLITQKGGRQGQAEGMLILFILLCAGRNSLKPKIQGILNTASSEGNIIFHQDDYNLGAQHVIDQFSLMAVSGIRELGPSGVEVIKMVCEKFNGYSLFENTIKRNDLMKYDITDVILKSRFIHNVIESILEEM